jgi:uncharacterized protein HemX
MAEIHPCTPKQKTPMVANNLEPRVATIESELKSLTRDVGILTKDVRDLVGAVKEQSDNYDAQLRKLTVDLVGASGPRPMNWGVLLNGVGLSLAIGAAVFYPMQFRITELSERADSFMAEFRAHEKLTLHPVGTAKVDALDRLVQEEATNLEKELADLRKSIDEIRLEGSPAMQVQIALMESRIAALMDRSNGWEKSPSGKK